MHFRFSLIAFASYQIATQIVQYTSCVNAGKTVNKISRNRFSKTERPVVVSQKISFLRFWIFFPIFLLQEKKKKKRARYSKLVETNMVLNYVVFESCIPSWNCIIIYFLATFVIVGITVVRLFARSIDRRRRYCYFVCVDVKMCSNPQNVLKLIYYYLFGLVR